MVLFRSPGDRKQMAMVAQRIFAKDRSNVMKVYAKALWVSFGEQSTQDSNRETSCGRGV